MSCDPIGLNTLPISGRFKKRKMKNIEDVLRELDVPVHHRRPQARLQRWLHFRYHRRPDNGESVSPAKLRAWARDLGVVEEELGVHAAAIAAANAGVLQRPMDLSPAQLLQLCKTVLCADREHARHAAAGGVRTNPAHTLLHAVAQTERRIFDPAVQLFPHDLQWVVSASAAAPAQFTPSLTALEAELEAFEAKCTCLEEARRVAMHKFLNTPLCNGGEDEDGGEGSQKLNVDGMLQRATQVSMKIGENARTASRLLEKFSTEYAPQISSWISPSLERAAPQKMGPMVKEINCDLLTIIGVLESITIARRSFDTFEILAKELERTEHLSRGRFDHATLQEKAKNKKALYRFRAQLETMPREKSP